MKVYHKALVVAGLCVSMASGLVGCGNTTLDGSKTVATVGEKTIHLGRQISFSDTSRQKQKAIMKAC